MKRTPIFALAGLVLLGVMLGGCPLLPGGSTPGTSLEGTWKAAGPSGTLPVNLILTVNASNQIINVRLDPPGTDVAPPMPVVIQVDGNSATFNATFPLALGSLAFEGTLNDTANVLTGTMAVKLNIAGAPPDASSGVIFTKQ